MVHGVLVCESAAAAGVVCISEAGMEGKTVMGHESMRIHPSMFVTTKALPTDKSSVKYNGYIVCGPTGSATALIDSPSFSAWYDADRCIEKCLQLYIYHFSASLCFGSKFAHLVLLCCIVTKDFIRCCRTAVPVSLPPQMTRGGNIPQRTDLNGLTQYEQGSPKRQRNFLPWIHCACYIASGRMDPRRLFGWNWWSLTNRTGRNRRDLSCWPLCFTSGSATRISPNVPPNPPPATSRSRPRPRRRQRPTGRARPSRPTTPARV